MLHFTQFAHSLPGESQPGNRLSGVGVGILHRLPNDRLKIVIDYAYGIDAIRSHGRGANSVGLLLQWDLERAHGGKSGPAPPNRWWGWHGFWGE